MWYYLDRSGVDFDSAVSDVLRVLVTGSRELTRQEDRALVFSALTECAISVRWDMIVIHGACPTGADVWADEFADEYREYGVQKEVYPAKWNEFGKAAGQLRNQEMVDTKPDIVLAFPFGISPGTRGCMDKAHKADIPVYEFYPRQ